MNKYILCIDNGLTKAKAVLFDIYGKEVASSSVNTPIQNIGSHSEIDAIKQWENSAKVIRETILKSGIETSMIVGVGNAAYGNGINLLDNDGLPLRNAISSMDSRAESIVDKWNNEGISSYDKTYTHMFPSQPIPLLYWLKINEPENYKKIQSILLAKDWINYKLTGKPATDYTDASMAGLLNLKTKSYDTGILELYKIEDIVEKLPEVKKSTEILGYVSKQAAKETGLKEGTPVIVGMLDAVACAIGSGVYDSSKYSITAGTWGNNIAVEDKLIASDDLMLWAMFADPDRYYCLEGSPTSAVNLEWFVNNIMMGHNKSGLTHEEIYHSLDESISKFKPDEIKMLYMPFIYKSRLSKKMEGSFFGINASSTIYHLARAIYEGVAFAHLKHISKFRKADIIKNSATLSGGVSNSKVWCQMFADILNIDVITTKTSQVGALGTAISVAVGTGIYKDFNQAINSMVKTGTVYHPNFSANEIYMKKYEEFIKVIDLFDS